MSFESGENDGENNLITNFDNTVELIQQVEGQSWYRSYLQDVERLRKKIIETSELGRDPETVFGSFHGDGGVTRWMVMGNGEVRFSGSHDTGNREKVKTKKALDLGFKLY